MKRLDCGCDLDQELFCSEGFWLANRLGMALLHTIGVTDPDAANELTRDYETAKHAFIEHANPSAAESLLGSPAA